MAPNGRPRPNLEKRIPKHILDNVERECSRSDCRSKDVVLRYFNNDKDDQPRFFCNGCKQLFTLGGNLRKPYRKSKNKTKKAKARTKANNLQAQGAKIGESSGLASCMRMKTRSSRLGLCQTTNCVEPGIDTKAKSIEVIEDEEETDYSHEEMEEEEMEGEMEDTDEDSDEDESEEEDGESHPLDLNQLPHRESNVAREDEEMYQEEEIEELIDSRLPREGNEVGIPTDEVPMELDTTLHEGLHLDVMSTELLRLKAKRHLLIAEVTLEEVIIEEKTILMGLDLQEMKRHRELENSDMQPAEGILYGMKQGFEVYISLWRVGPLDGARYEMLVARKATLQKTDESIKILAREVDEMKYKLVPHATMVRIEKKAKQLWDHVVALTN